MNPRFDLDPRILVGPGDLLRGPHVVQVTTFDDAGLKLFRRQLARAFEANQEIIPVFIDSEGGSTWAEMAMFDELDAARRHAKIATVVSGRALSAAADLLASGDKGLRFAAPMATIMVHDMGDVPDGGKIEELRASYSETRREHELLMSRFEDNCHQPRGYFRKIIHQEHHNADWYMDAKEAKRHKIIDHIGIPEMSVRVTVAFKFGLPGKVAK